MKTLAAVVLVSSFAVHAAPPPIVEPSPNGETSITETPMQCPTANDKARKLYNDGKDAEEAGKMDEALELFQQAVKADPKFCDAMDNMGLTYRRSGKIDEAVEWYRKSIAINAKNGTSRMNLGAALRMKKSYAESAAAYSDLIKALPKDPEGYYGLATIHLDLDKPAEAIEPMLMAEKLYPSR